MSFVWQQYAAKMSVGFFLSSMMNWIMKSKSKSKGVSFLFLFRRDGNSMSMFLPCR